MDSGGEGAGGEDGAPVVAPLRAVGELAKRPKGP